MSKDGLQTYKFELTGTPMGLLMHNDDVIAADTLEAWRKAPENKRRSKPGDDRAPSWAWITYLYRNSDNMVVIPAENLIAMLIKGGASFKAGRGTLTLKSEAAASVFFDEYYPIMVGPQRKPVSIAGIDDVAVDDVRFADQQQFAKKCGFELDIRRASVGTAKHVRVRPRFRQWSIAGEFKVYDDGAMPLEILKQLFNLCGRRVGLGDWRPSSPKKPGPNGTFIATVKKA